MSISELIKQLQSIQQKFGDREVGIEVTDRCNTHTATIVRVEGGEGDFGLLSLAFIDDQMDE